MGYVVESFCGAFALTHNLNVQLCHRCAVPPLRSLLLWSLYAGVEGVIILGTFRQHQEPLPAHAAG